MTGAGCCPTCGQGISGRVDPRELQIPLSPKERIIFECLLRSFGREVDTGRIVDAMYGGDPDGGPDNATRVYSVIAHHLRRKIKPFGLTVKGRSGGRGGNSSASLQWLSA